MNIDELYKEAVAVAPEGAYVQIQFEASGFGKPIRGVRIYSNDKDENKIDVYAACFSVALERFKAAHGHEDEKTDPKDEV